VRHGRVEPRPAGVRGELRAPDPRLDTTDPETVQAVPVDGSLFVISSKSGSTIEPSVMHEYFWERTGQDGSRFVAVTDPGSKLGQTAREQGFLRVFENRADIGGRYSALSFFGLVPAVLAGLDVGPLLDGAAAMVKASGPEAYPENPGLELGARWAAWRAAAATS
jgi:transaldolase/glucose-6-phosphate isomerase